MNKKLLVLLPAAMLMLASCGGGNTDPSKTDPSKTDPSTTSTTSETTSTTSETTSQETTSEGEVVNYGTLEKPLTVKEALEIPTVEETYEDAKTSETKTRIYSKQMLYVKGTVSGNSILEDKGTYYKKAYLTDSSTTDELYVYSFSKTEGTEVYVNDEIIINGYLVNYDGTLEIATPGGMGADAYAWLKGDITRGTSAITVVDNEWADVVLSAESGVNGTKATATVTAKEGMVVDKVKANSDLLTGNEGVYEFTIKGPTEITVTGHEDGGEEVKIAATLVKGTNASDITVNGKAGLKCGTSKAVGDMEIQLGAGATKMYIHLAAWSGTTAEQGATTLTATKCTLNPTSLTAKADSVFSGTTTDFTVTDEDDFLLEVAVSNAEEGATIKVECAKRFIVWDVSYVK